MGWAYRKEVGGLPKSHLPGLYHVDGVLKGLLLGHLGAVDADALELEAGLEGGVCGERKERVRNARGQNKKGEKPKERNQESNQTRTGPGKFIVLYTPRKCGFHATRGRMQVASPRVVTRK